MQLVLIHTGGTIGMAETPAGLAPMRGLVETALAARLGSGTELKSHVFDPLLDSADVGHRHWNEMLDVIRSHTDASVIITHGTDTMAFTGAALAQALAGEERRVILCGSMHPLGTGGDAEQNLSLAVDAVQTAEPGVFLAFGGHLLDAAGLVKHDSQKLDAFRAQPQERPEAPRHRRFTARKLAILKLSPCIPAH
ncbi:MAG: asparaginase domain-containing protein [Rhizobium sp.]|nr:asparaginase domain-containing protein [Rhizobium sp.]